MLIPNDILGINFKLQPTFLKISNLHLIFKPLDKIQIMNEMTLLQQAFQLPPIPIEAAGFIIFGSWLYLVYKAIARKEEAFIKYITGIPLISGVALFIGISLFAIDVISGIPTIGPIVVFVLDIIVYFLVGYLLAGLTYFIYQVYVGEKKIPGF